MHQIYSNLFIVFFTMLIPVLGISQNSFQGNISSQEGPLNGAAICIKALDKGTYADANGDFNIENLPNGKHSVEFSFTGYKKQIVNIELPGQEFLNIKLLNDTQLLKDVIVTSTWASENTPIAQENISGAELVNENLGQDVPFLLRWTPSMVVTSDAGAGIGYTGLRIRGTDPSRINVTINGIPLNDAESQGVFWVDLPDIAGSTENIQIQRGVGTSTNGSGAFGGSINLATNTLNAKPYAELFNSVGSFNSRKHSLKAGSGLINKHWAFDTRVSLTNSDGYVDRATSDLSSLYLAGGYYGEKTVVKAIYFTGHERTYQSWYGTPESRILGDEDAMKAHAAREGYSDSQLESLLNSGRTYNFYQYKDEVDDYQQDHYQLHFSHAFTANSNLNAALHYTKGKGFFEQFRNQDNFSDYQLADLRIGQDTISSGDFIRRRWLDNDYLGYTLGYNLELSKLNLTIGNSYHHYTGGHYGELIWGQYADAFQPGYRYYDNTGIKKDANLFAKAEIALSDKLDGFVDAQFRNVQYEVEGVDNDLRNLNEERNFSFFNPKVGLSYKTSETSRAYAHLGIANREPNRNDIIDALDPSSVKSERLADLELGYEYQTTSFGFGINLYNMAYKDQLVLTGELNDVGSPIRVNTPKSYRRGVEAQFNWSVTEKLNWEANLTLSQNKIEQFTATVYDYTNGFDIISNVHEDTDISFSPSVIASSRFSYQLSDWIEFALLSKFVGKQYLDNTQNEDRVINEYFVNDFRIVLNPSIKKLSELRLLLNAYNIFDEEYSSNGYTYSYVFGNPVTENFYYPQAGRHFMVGLLLGF